MMVPRATYHIIVCQDSRDSKKRGTGRGGWLKGEDAARGKRFSLSPRKFLIPVHFNLSSSHFKVQSFL